MAHITSGASDTAKGAGEADRFSLNNADEAEKARAIMADAGDAMESIQASAAKVTHLNSNAQRNTAVRRFRLTQDVAGASAAA